MIEAGPRRRVVLTLVAAALFASGCSSTAGTTPSLPAEIGTVTVFDDELASYVDAAEASESAAERSELFDELVAAPITEGCVADGEYADLAVSIIDSNITDLTAAASDLEALDLDLITTTLENELASLQQTLPGPAVTVCVTIAGDQTADFIGSQMGGVTGVTAGAGRVVLVIDPTVASAEALAYTLAHEYHHSWLTSSQEPLPTFDLLGYLLFEGRADTFARLQHPDHDAPWTNQLTDEEQLEQWERIEPDLTSTNPQLLQSVMFGGAMFPQWTGYDIGNQIVANYVELNPTVSTETWSLLDPAELLAGSRFPE